jgi:hypothetical protein
MIDCGSWLFGRQRNWNFDGKFAYLRTALFTCSEMSGDEVYRSELQNLSNGAANDRELRAALSVRVRVE